MKIAYILPSLACTGPIIVAGNLIKHLKKRAEKIDVYYFNDRRELVFDCLTFRIDPVTEFPFEEYDIIHSHMYLPDKYLWKHRKKIRAKTVSTVHQFISYSLLTDRNIIISKIFSPLWYKYLNAMDQVVYISGSLMKESEKHITAKRSTCIYNGIDTENADADIPPEDLEQILKLKKEYKLIGNFSNFTSRKGVDQLISGISQNKELALLLIGDGKVFFRLKKQADKLKVSDRCLFLGFRTETKSYYQFLDSYAMTSRSEAFGLSMVEAAASQVPVVCSDIPTFRELFNENEVTYFQPGNIDSLNNALIESLTRNPEKVAKAFERYRQNYSVEKMAEEYWKLYVDLIKK